MGSDNQFLQDLRKKIFITGYRGGIAHFASSFSCLEILYTLYCKEVLCINSKDSKWNDRDRFILSKGHAGLALYGVLCERGLVSEKDFNSYLQENGKIGGEPCMRDCEWIEATTGSLGHGLPFAQGIAMALKNNKSNAKVYVLLGDGECEEGTIWESAISAVAHELDNLIVIIDCNQIQKMGAIETIIGEPFWQEKWKAFGWDVSEVDGHDVDALKCCLERITEKKPRLIIANTIKGKGVSIMENNPIWHFKLPNKKELKVFKEELNITDCELE